MANLKKGKYEVLLKLGINDKTDSREIDISIGDAMADLDIDCDIGEYMYPANIPIIGTHMQCFIVNPSDLEKFSKTAKDKAVELGAEDGRLIAYVTAKNGIKTAYTQEEYCALLSKKMKVTVTSIHWTGEHQVCICYRNISAER